MKNETARREIESLDYYLQNHTDDYSEESHTAMMMAIDALNNVVLDKIRDEIEQMRAKPDNMVKLIGDFISIDYVLGVINKYMEDKNER